MMTAMPSQPKVARKAARDGLRVTVTSRGMRRGSNDEPSRIDVQKIIAGTLLAILVIGGVAFYLNRPTHRVEHLSQLIRQTRPWCSSYHLTDQHTDTSRASLVALAHSGSPHWEPAERRPWRSVRKARSLQ